MTAAVALHLITLLFVAGGGIGGLLMHVALGRAIANNPADGLPIAKTGLLFATVARTAAQLMIVSGLWLMYSRGWGDATKPWLLGKFAIFIILSLNGAIVGQKAGGKLVGALIAFASGREVEQARATIASSMQTMHRFHLVQVGGLATMVLLGVFGPRA